MRYFIVTGVSRLGVTMTTHEFICEGTALLEDVYAKLASVHAIRGIRVRQLHDDSAVRLAEKRGNLISGRVPG